MPRLSALIRQGLAGTEQAHGVFFQAANRCCALGAAMRAQGMGPADIADFLDDWDHVMAKKARCPQWLTCGLAGDVETIVIHMNDDHRVSREEIAAWLEEQGL